MKVFLEGGFADWSDEYSIARVGRPHLLRSTVGW